jgi:hypothetical protein
LIILPWGFMEGNLSFHKLNCSLEYNEMEFDKNVCSLAWRWQIISIVFEYDYTLKYLWCTCVLIWKCTSLLQTCFTTIYILWMLLFDKVMMSIVLGSIVKRTWFIQSSSITQHDEFTYQCPWTLQTLPKFAKIFVLFIVICSSLILCFKILNLF